jgi:glycogen debranching enzyme
VDEDVIQIAEHYYIRATSSRADERTRVLKHGDTFGVFDRFGDVQPVGLGEQGLFHEGTRHLSRLELRLARLRPLLLSSTINETNDLFAVDLTNPDMAEGDGRIVLPRGVLHVFRTKFIWQGALHERVRVSNYGMATVSISLVIRFDADFVDIFEVRGQRRERRGTRFEPRVAGSSCTLGYEGLDRRVRETVIDFFPDPAELQGGSARFEVTLAPQEHGAVTLAIRCRGEASRPLAAGNGPEVAAAHDRAQTALAHSVAEARRHQAQVTTGNEQFNGWLDRSSADLQMMMTETPHGLYPYAGVPWFSTVFGRDGIITALQLLTLAPEAARGVLDYLAAGQADRASPEQDAEPGKILHETRTGEMAALGEVPFGRYYGSVDATPLFVVLAGAYYRRTADRGFAERLWPHVERALRWMETSGDPDGDGFVEYARRSAHGLVQQGWKDSHDSVFHADGTMAEPPIALCEVQGYAYAARLAAAELATALDLPERAHELTRAAQALQKRFEEAFWCDDLGTYALALDGHKRPCRVRTSNPGHCLFAGIASPLRAQRTSHTLLEHPSFSGWGIRTLATSEARYNPMSYHNGSVWPHDNALIAAGFGRYGLRRQVLRVLEGLFGASQFLELRRMPELFCGFDRRTGEGPTLYPVACLPQAWASGSVFMVLQACLGLSVDAAAQEVRFDNPVLPEWLPEVRINHLEVGGATADLLLERHPHDVGVTVLRRNGPLRVTVVK